MSEINNNFVRYPLELFMKYKSSNTDIPDSFHEYFIPNININHKRNSCLSNPEIRAYLNVQMSNRDTTKEDEKTYDKIQNLLNKINKNNIKETAKEIMNLKDINIKKLYKFSELIIIKAINEIAYSYLYGLLLQELLQYNINVNDEKVYIKSCIITICQDILEEITDTRQINKGFTYERNYDYSKLKLTGLVKYIGELYNYNIINENIIINIFNLLYTQIVLNNKDYYEGLYTLVSTIINKLKKNNLSNYNYLKTQINNILEADAKNKSLELNNREIQFKFKEKRYKFKIEEILDLFMNQN
jgi:hypothetical protein